MPAIQPARLRMQAARLAELFDQPAAFARALRGLFEIYANRTHRAGQSGEPPPLLRAYNVPPPVPRSVINSLRASARQHAEPTIKLSQALWSEPYIETRLVAVELLGMAPVEPPEPVLAQLNAWLHPLPEDRVLSALLNTGLARLREDNPSALLTISRDWLNETRQVYQSFALRALRPLAQDPRADHLPKIFTLLTPFLRRAPIALRPDLLDLLSVMALRSPVETAFVLRQNLSALDNPDTSWLIRQILHTFPPQQQASLKEALQNSILR